MKLTQLQLRKIIRNVIKEAMTPGLAASSAKRCVVPSAYKEPPPAPQKQKGRPTCSQCGKKMTLADKLEYQDGDIDLGWPEICTDCGDDVMTKEYAKTCRTWNKDDHRLGESKKLTEGRHGKIVVAPCGIKLRLDTKDYEYNYLRAENGNPVARQTKKDAGRRFRQGTNPDYEGMLVYPLEYIPVYPTDRASDPQIVYHPDNWTVYSDDARKGEIMDATFLQRIEDTIEAAASS